MLLWPNWPELLHTSSLLVRIYKMKLLSIKVSVHSNHRVMNNLLGKCTLNVACSKSVLSR